MDVAVRGIARRSTRDHSVGRWGEREAGRSRKGLGLTFAVCAGVAGMALASMKLKDLTFGKLAQVRTTMRLNLLAGRHTSRGIVQP